MSQKQTKIHTKSYIPLEPESEAKTCLCDLNHVQKDYLAALLHIQFLNTLYAGRFQFWLE